MRIFTKLPVRFWTNYRLVSTTPRVQHQSTVDIEDVRRHSYLAADWWNPTGPMKALHSMNQIRWVCLQCSSPSRNYHPITLRVPFIRDGLISTAITDKALRNTASSLKNVNILEVGCGAGLLTEVSPSASFDWERNLRILSKFSATCSNSRKCNWHRPRWRGHSSSSATSWCLQRCRVVQPNHLQEHPDRGAHQGECRKIRRCCCVGGSGARCGQTKIPFGLRWCFEGEFRYHLMWLLFLQITSVVARRIDICDDIQQDMLVLARWNCNRGGSLEFGAQGHARLESIHPTDWNSANFGWMWVAGGGWERLSTEWILFQMAVRQFWSMASPMSSGATVGDGRTHRPFRTPCRLSNNERMDLVFKAD